MKSSTWVKVKSLFFRFINLIIPAVTGSLAILAWIMFIDDDYLKYIDHSVVVFTGYLIFFITASGKSDPK